MDGGKDNWTSLVSTFLIRQEEVLLDWPRCVLSPSTIEIFYVPDDILLRIIPISWNSCKVLSLHPDQLTTSNTRLPGQSISTVGRAGDVLGFPSRQTRLLQEWGTSTPRRGGRQWGAWQQMSGWRLLHYWSPASGPLCSSAGRTLSCFPSPDQKYWGIIMSRLPSRRYSPFEI